MSGYIPNEREAIIYILSLVVSMLIFVTAFVVLAKSNDITPACEQPCYPYKAYEFDKEKQKCVCNMTRMYKDIK